jgi:hypothetical protein
MNDEKEKPVEERDTAGENGYPGREFQEEPEHPADFRDAGDWGRQGGWGTFSNRPDFSRDNEWDFGEKPDGEKQKPRD